MEPVAACAGVVSQTPEEGLMDVRLYVGNLSYSMTEDELRQLFSQAGQVKSAALIMDRETQRSRGFGFVEMASQADAEKAIQMFNNYETGGRRLVVNIARPREERGGGGGGGGFRGGGRGGRDRRRGGGGGGGNAGNGGKF